MKKALAFLNLLDNSGNLSITNVAVIVSVTKMAFAAQLTGMDVGAMLPVFLNYCHKRYTSDNANS